MASPNGPSNSNKGSRKRSLPPDSPSRQLLLDLSLQTVEYTNQLHSKLDREALEREHVYRQALDAAASEHKRVRLSAQRFHELSQLESESRRRQEEEDEQAAIDRRRQELADLELARGRQALEQAKQLAEKEKNAAEAAAAALREAEEHRRAQKVREDEEAAKREQEQRAKEKKAAQQQEPSQVPKSPSPATSAIPSAPSQSRSAQTPATATNNLDPTPSSAQSPGTREADHERYLKLHASLKELRKHVVAQSKLDQRLKNQIGDMRREIRKSVGQLTAELEARKIPLRKIRTVLNDAIKVQQPSVDISPYIISQPLPQVDPSQRQVSGLLLYLLNIFSKSVISQFIDETGADSRTADPIGIVAISIFAHNDYRWQGISLIDMLIAKFHVTCPVLFGIYGNEKTEAGRKRLGWRRDPDTGSWVSEQRHSERMTGLGSGFAALSLRNFQNSASRNPYPPSNYWRAMALILNTPTQQITQTHCTVLRAMIDQHVARFISFYGSAAVAVIRKAVVELPQQVTPPTTASNVLATLASTLRRDYNLTL